MIVTINILNKSSMILIIVVVTEIFIFSKNIKLVQVGKFIWIFLYFLDYLIVSLM